MCNRKACTRGSSTAEANLAFLHGGWWLPHSPRRAIRLSCLSVAGPNDNSFLTWQRLCMEDPQCGENQEPQNLSGLLSSWSPECSAAWCLSGYGFQGHQLPGAQGSADRYIFTMLVMNKPHTSAGRRGKSSSSENLRVESEWRTLASQTGLW